MSPSYWVEALSAATGLLNILPTKTLTFSTPHHALHGNPPAYEHLRVFGCKYYPNLSATAPHKLAPRSALCVFLGYSDQKKDIAASTSLPIASSSRGMSSLMKLPFPLLIAMDHALLQRLNFLMILTLYLILLDHIICFSYRNLDDPGSSAAPTDPVVSACRCLHPRSPDDIFHRAMRGFVTSSRATRGPDSISHHAWRGLVAPYRATCGHDGVLHRAKHDLSFVHRPRLHLVSASRGIAKCRHTRPTARLPALGTRHHQRLHAPRIHGSRSRAGCSISSAASQGCCCCPSSDQPAPHGDGRETGFSRSLPPNAPWCPGPTVVASLT
jgi:hypothetical protein